VLVLAAFAFPPQSAGAPLVLLIEDHDDTRQMYLTFLSSSYRVIDAANAEQALTHLAERRPDLIITDLSLPGIDGFELIARVRRDRSTANVPVICLSGYGGPPHDERARAAGADRILQKPCTPDALEQAAQELLRDSAGGSEQT
jgi:two-component system cell cycle response regulator DivK